LPSKQVLKLCEKIQKDCGIVCTPESFHVERLNYSFHVWNMDVNVEKSTGFSKHALEFLGNATTCTSSYYMKDLLKMEKLSSFVDLDCSEVVIIPK